MADSIRGLTVKISADATEFKKEINAVRKDSKSAQAELTALQKSLQLEFDGEKFARAQKVAQEAIDKTAQEAEMLRSRLKQLEESGNVDTSEYRKVQTELAQAETKAQQLQEKLKELNNIKFDKLANNVKSVGDKIQGVGKALTPVSVAAAGAITGIAALGVKTASTGAELDDLSQRLGISAEKVQELKYVAAQAGVDWEVYNKGIIRARAALLDLSSGISNNATKAVQSLGISLENFSSQEEMIDGVMTALAGVKDKTLQAAYANEIFGDKIANEMLPYLNAGAEEIQKFKSEFEGMSYLTNEQVKSLATLDDTIYLLKQSLSNVVLQIGASLSPLIQSLTEYVNANVIPMLQRIADWFNSLTVGQQELVIKILLVTAALAPLATGIGKIVSLVGSIIKILPQLGAAFSALEAHPIVLIIAAIAAVLLILYTQCEAFRESINNLIGTLTSALQPILDVIIGLISKIMSLLTPIITLIGENIASAINMIMEILSPVLEMVSTLLELLSPLLDVCIIPLTVALNALKVPLQIIGQLLNWLTPLFEFFGKVVTSIFKGVIWIVNKVLGWVEDAVNWCIGIINKLIDGINSALGWLGVNIAHIGEVKLRLDTSDVENIDDVNAVVKETQESNQTGGGTVYDQIGADTASGDTYNYDYSKTEKTQNVTVVIENYAKEVDVDDLVEKINVKLAEAM
ncbi:MAG TPA: hypothetical protein DEV87_06515 [Clostridiales bacterium]|nr:hypothetical protein [Clostridiales bacterium]